MANVLKCAINTICRIIVKAGEDCISSDDFIDYLKAKGVNIGHKTKFFDPKSNVVDVTKPWMLKIGSYCKITSGVVILAHDYSRSVLRRSHNAILAYGKDTVIGDNVFIGMNAIILCGCHIGNNVIIGAGSVVSGNIPDNVVITGNPAKIIRTMDEHFEIRKRKNIEEAKNNFRRFKETYGRNPTIKEMGHFFPLYCHAEQELIEAGIDLNWSGDEKTEILQSFLNTEHLYESYEEFCKDVENCNR